MQFGTQSRVIGGTAAFLLAALVLVFLAYRSRAPERLPRPRNAAADAAYERATVSHILGAPACGSSFLCGFEFVRYEPSALELKWAAQAPSFAGRECAVMESERLDWQAQLEGVIASSGSTSSLSVGRSPTWSTMVLRDQRTGLEQSVALEPLAGVMRDPRPICPGMALQPSVAANGPDSRDFTLLDPAFYRHIAKSLKVDANSSKSELRITFPPRAILFDLGATRWDPLKVTGFRWTVESYARFDIDFDAIYAWEASPTTTAAFFGPMPVHLAARTHFYNVPVSRPGSVGAGVADALAVLLSVARPEDFVVFKLDIDADVLEEEIALALLADDALARRVDDFYFEHHSNTHGIMDAPWGECVRSLHDSILLFQAFRKRGIRAHSWP